MIQLCFPITNLRVLFLDWIANSLARYPVHEMNSEEKLVLHLIENSTMQYSTALGGLRARKTRKTDRGTHPGAALQVEAFFSAKGPFQNVIGETP